MVTRMPRIRRPCNGVLARSDAVSFPLRHATNAYTTANGNHRLPRARTSGRNEDVVGEVARDDAGVAEDGVGPRVEVLELFGPAFVDEALHGEVVDERMVGLAGVHEREVSGGGGQG